MEESTTSDKRIRFKEYKCVFPGCSEGLKTKYNCISHVWNIHLRNINNITESYKDLKESDKERARDLCLPYIFFVKDAETSRKRKPYDLSDVLTSKNENLVKRAVDNTQLQPANCMNQSCIETMGKNDFNIPQQSQNDMQTQNEIDTLDFGQIRQRQETFQNLFYPQQQQDVIQQQIVSDPNMLSSYTVSIIGPKLSDQLITHCTDFIRIYSITESVKRLHVYGEIFAENGFLQRSDRKSKTDIRPISDALETLCSLTGKSFKYANNTSKVQFGFIAQELREVLPDAVHEDSDGYLSIDPLALLPFIVESLKDLSSNLQRIQRTNGLEKVFKEVKELAERIKQFECEEKNVTEISLGPDLYVVPSAIVLSLFSVYFAVTGRFPFLWIFFVLAAICFWMSHQFSPNGSFSSVAIVLNFVLLNLLLVSVSASVLIGSVLQLYLGVYISVMLFLWGGSQLLQTSFFNFFIVSFSFCCLACWCIFMLQPTFRCSVITPMKHNELFKEYLTYITPNEVMFNLSSEVPWNCFQPRLEAVGKKIIFQQYDNVFSIRADEKSLLSLDTDSIQINLVCSSVRMKCVDYTISKQLH
ncbi:hypothetical protein EIN_154460 [Entamoeba invadens IP1]|uniref:Peptidase S74 domain-containing protein n=1 Tax=Entamoeba invadens IP1 TaxID=370355 RepID=A0A0A1U922_ENTIV|nr:hypothetical protein EIN_154460 [Entamoeba invadens IP1]ELP91379.1 hypothetical protein EIN_154460 [Entamoeba invadens IP1]|eukprot:XP_004258150.1 hypothetical protein EIN_154460 [Entamoeba invadens IP1]